MQKGFHALAIIAAIVWFALNGLLWYAKPSDLLWLLGSAILGAIFFIGFYLYLMWSDEVRWDRDNKL
ncbi:MAG: hypothetical protein ACXWI7_00980 [Croceibacterium sp.]